MHPVRRGHTPVGRRLYVAGHHRAHQRQRRRQARRQHARRGRPYRRRHHALGGERGHLNHLRPGPYQEPAQQRRAPVLYPYRIYRRRAFGRRDAPGYRAVLAAPRHPARHPRCAFGHRRPHATPGARTAAPSARDARPRCRRRGDARPRRNRRGLHQAQLLQPVLGILRLQRARPDCRGHLAHDGRRPRRLPGPRRHAVRSLQPHLWLWRRTHDHGAQPLL